MENNNSLWLKSINSNKKYESLNQDIKTDILIIGAGLTGVTIGYYLSKKGYDVTIIDKSLVGEGTSGYTSAKITSEHGLIYKYLLESKGYNFAKLYFDANQEGLNNIIDIINNENINCDLERKSSYIYAEKLEEKEKLKEEFNAVMKINNKIAKLKEKLDIPIKNYGGLEFKNQAQFNPSKYLLGLINIIIQNKGKIYENTRAIKLENVDNNSNMKKVTIINENNEDITYSIYANKVVVATHYPIFNFPGLYFMKMYQEMSYVVAFKPNSDIKINGMYINIGNPKLSFRTAKDINNDDLLLFIGNNSLTKEKEDLKGKYQYLINIAKKYYPDLEVKYMWNTEDTISLDKIPYIGKYSNLIKDIYVATGYNKWGMTTSNISANIIVSMIEEKENIYIKIFDSTRLKPIKNKEEFGNMLDETFNSLIIQKIKNNKEKENAIFNMKNNTGKILNIDGKKIAIYKKDDNTYYTFKANCKHLGCEIVWNDLNKTWDCPCHGSRYEPTGEVIYSPSVKNLEKVDIIF